MRDVTFLDVGHLRLVAAANIFPVFMTHFVWSLSHWSCVLGTSVHVKEPIKTLTRVSVYPGVSGSKLTSDIMTSKLMPVCCLNRYTSYILFQNLEPTCTCTSLSHFILNFFLFYHTWMSDSGSTYQDILNMDQSGVTMGNLVNARANPFSAAPVAQPAQVGLFSYILSNISRQYTKYLFKGTLSSQQGMELVSYM